MNETIVKNYRKKPVVIKAIRYTGDNLEECKEFCPLKIEWHGVYIGTLEGDMKVSDGDYIIQGVAGEFYPCKEDIFLKTYEEVKQ